MFKDLNILVISPDPWNWMKLSKHHYAIELAKANNTVYYLEPPSKKIGRSTFEIIEVEHGIKLIKHNIGFPYMLHFKWRSLFDLLMNIHVKKIAKNLPEIDIIWSFEGRVYSDFKQFNAKYIFYQPMDYISSENQIAVAKNADMVMTVGDNIKNDLNNRGIDSNMVNHGLGSEFENIISWSEKSKDLQVCYTGSLMIDGLDRDLMLDLVSNCPEVIFNFIGPSYQVDDIEKMEFLAKIKTFQNVQLHGLKSSEEIAEIYSSMDIMLVCYDNMKEPNGGSNSHKVMEYLASGRVILSTPLKSFANLGLLEIENDRRSYVLKFKKIISSIEEFNSLELQTKRKQYAYRNTYSKIIESIYSNFKKVD